MSDLWVSEGEEQWWTPQVTFTAGNVEIVWKESGDE